MGKYPGLSELPDLLRTASEPCRYYTEAAVHAVLTADPVAYFRHVRDAALAIAEGRARAVLPPKQLFPDTATGGDFRVMPCEWRDGSRVVKTVKVIGTNAVQRAVPDQITVGRLLVLDPAENFVCAIAEACLLSSARTGLCAAMAISALAPAGGRLLIVGSGRVGFYAAFFAIAACGVREVVLCDRLSERAREAAQWLALRFPDAHCEARPLDTVTAADIVVIATTSAVPIASPPGWGARLVVSLGADADTQSELDPGWSRCADLFCDTDDSLRFGDLNAWSKAGLIDPSRVTGLLDALRKPPPDSDRPRVFVSTGSALFDTLTAAYLLERDCAGDQSSSSDTKS